MNTKHYCSSGLRSGSIFLKIIGVLCVAGAILAWFMDGPGWTLMISGASIFLVGVLFKGIYPISCAAEDQLAEAGYYDFIDEGSEKK